MKAIEDQFLSIDGNSFFDEPSLSREIAKIQMKIQETKRAEEMKARGEFATIKNSPLSQPVHRQSPISELTSIDEDFLGVKR